MPITKPAPRFCLEDSVTFELSRKDPTRPRYVCNKDTGYSGSSTQGLITHIDAQQIEVEYIINNETLYAWFPNYQNIAYNEDQWSWPGYLKLVPTKPKYRLVSKTHSGTIYTTLERIPD